MEITEYTGVQLWFYVPASEVTLIIKPPVQE
jgi:hypothetical protein